MHPSSSAVAAADVSGRITVLRRSTEPGGGGEEDEEDGDGAGEEDGELLPTHAHWHSMAVRALEWSPDGEHLYSGGGEAVLVKWKVGGETMAQNLENIFCGEEE